MEVENSLKQASDVLRHGNTAPGTKMNLLRDFIGTYKSPGVPCNLVMCGFFSPNKQKKNAW